MDVSFRLVWKAGEWEKSCWRWSLLADVSNEQPESPSRRAKTQTSYFPSITGTGSSAFRFGIFGHFSMGKFVCWRWRANGMMFSSELKWKNSIFVINFPSAMRHQKAVTRSWFRGVRTNKSNCAPPINLKSPRRPAHSPEILFAVINQRLIVCGCRRSEGFRCGRTFDSLSSAAEMKGVS